MPVLPLLALLREATAAHHARTEAVIPILDPALDRAGYAEILRRMLAVYAPLEFAIERALAADARVTELPDPTVLDLPARRKVPLLRRDLVALGDDPALVEAAVVSALDASDVGGAWPRTAAEAIGALYVLEGATLGGQIVCRQVAPRLGLDLAAGCAFYGSYGPRVGPMWRAFGAFVGAFDAAAPQARDAVVDAARATFDRLTARFAPAQERADTSADTSAGVG
jgi:heme oxygenase